MDEIHDEEIKELSIKLGANVPFLRPSRISDDYTGIQEVICHSIEFLTKNFNKLWIHCKNLEAIDILSEFSLFNFFWHQNDDFTLTSKNFVWTYPGKRVCNKSVLVMDDARQYSGQVCFGLCSDYLA